jgi:hypothetical protein
MQKPLSIVTHIPHVSSGSFCIFQDCSNWFRKLLNLNAEAQRTLRTAEDI